MQPRWLRNVDVVDAVVEACLLVDGRLLALSRVCSALRAAAVPMAFRRLELGGDVRLMAVREAQVAMEPGLTERTETLVIMGDCPAAGRWIERCSPLFALALVQPRRATAWKALKPIQRCQITRLELDVEPTSRGQRGAIDRVLWSYVTAAERGSASLKLTLRNRSNWRPEPGAIFELKEFDIVSDRPDVIVEVLDNYYGNALDGLRLQRIADDEDAWSTVPPSPMIDPSNPAAPAIDPRA